MFEKSTMDARPETDTHLCVAGRKCVDPTITNGDGEPKRQAATTEAPNTVCQPCWRRIRIAIEDLPGDYAGLHVSLGEITAGTGIHVSSTPTPPLPIDKNKYALMQAISDGLDRAAEIVSDVLHCDPPTGTIATRLESCARMVSTNLDKLLRSPSLECFAWERCTSVCGPKGCDTGEHFNLTERTGMHFALALRDLHTQARATTGEWEKVLRVPTPCGACAAPFLYQNPTTGTVFCKDCGSDWTEGLLRLAGEMSKRQQEDQEAMEKAELEQKLAEAQEALAAAEQRAAVLERGFQLAATDPEYADWPAKRFAEAVLQEAS